jgi:hypothetical protein
MKRSFKKHKKLKTHLEVPPGPPLLYYVTNTECCYSCYLQVLNVVNFKNVLLKLFNQFYMDILYEIVYKIVHTFMKKILLANFC